MILLFLLVFGIIAMMLSWIFTSAAYNYTQHKNTGPFSAHFIEHAAIHEAKE